MSALNAAVPISQSALSQHLGVLRATGLVRARRVAQSVYYALASGPAPAVIASLRDAYCGSGPPAKG